MTLVSPSDIPGITYLVMVVLTYRLCVRALRHEMITPFSSLATDWTDVGACLFFGLFGALAWPLWIVPVLIARLFRRRLRTPDDVLRFIGGQSKRERLAIQEQRIAELERELQIR